MDYTITDIGSLICHAWHKDGGSYMINRKDNGIVICDGSEFSFFANDKEVKTDSRHVLILPKGASYNFRCRKSGVTYTYNFNGTVPEAIPYSIETNSISSCISHARKIQRASDVYTKIGLMYRIIGDALNGRDEQEIPEIIKPQVEYIRQNFGSCDITNSKLASMTNISEIYFRKLFVKSMGTSPHEYICSMRIEQAKKLLLEGKSVSEAALLCGFSNLYYFSASFKKKVGMSPSTYASFYDKI